MSLTPNISTERNHVTDRLRLTPIRALLLLTPTTSWRIVGQAGKTAAWEQLPLAGVPRRRARALSHTQIDEVAPAHSDLSVGPFDPTLPDRAWDGRAGGSMSRRIARGGPAATNPRHPVPGGRAHAPLPIDQPPPTRSVRTQARPTRTIDPLGKSWRPLVGQVTSPREAMCGSPRIHRSAALRQDPTHPIWIPNP